MSSLAFCTECGAPANPAAAHCTSCGAPLGRDVAADTTVLNQGNDLDATLAGPPPPAYAPPPPPIAAGAFPGPVPGAAPAPLPYVAQAPPGPRRTTSGTTIGLIVGGVILLVGAAVVVTLLLTRGSSQAAAQSPTQAPTTTINPSTSVGQTSPATNPPAQNSAPGPGPTGLPNWVSPVVGSTPPASSLVSLPNTNGATIFRTHGGNHCVATGGELTCQALSAWAPSQPPPSGQINACQSGTGTAYAFDLSGSAAATAGGCDAVPAIGQFSSSQYDASVLSANQVTEMQPGIYCLVQDGATSVQSGVACWSPQTGHGFMIGNQFWSTW